MKSDYIDQCYYCGRFVSKENGFYDRESPDDDMSYIVLFCNEEHADKYTERLTSNVKEMTNVK